MEDAVTETEEAKKQKGKMEDAVIETATFRMQSGRSTTELISSAIGLRLVNRVRHTRVPC